MKNQILSTYEITPNTMALLPARNPDYDTIALETTGELYIRKTPLQLIKQACLEGGSTYEGRKSAVDYLTGAKHKVPIPINPRENIYAFPTQSPKEFDCCWLFHEHIRSIKPYQRSNQPNRTIIQFSNNEQLKLVASYYTIEKQMHRTAYCILRFSSTGAALLRGACHSPSFVD